MRSRQKYFVPTRGLARVRRWGPGPNQAHDGSPELAAARRLPRPSGFCSACLGASHPAFRRPRSARGESSWCTRFCLVL